MKEKAMNKDSAVIDFEDFDREYHLSDLISPSALDNIFEAFKKISSANLAVFTPEASVFHTDNPFNSEDKASLVRIITQKKMTAPQIIKNNLIEIFIFPITHEFEIIGYLALGIQKDNTPLLKTIPLIGNIMSKSLEQVAGYKYRYLMTSGLHGQVVKESYGKLKKKALLLEESEKKYRELAGNLEKEVEKKTQRIKETQGQLMQQDKMASIGQLAAGVAHEINNPMGFINSNLNTLKEYEKDIHTLIGEYQSFVQEIEKRLSKHPDHKEILKNIVHIQTREKEADIDFLLNDWSSLVDESISGAERIKKIVIDLKDFAHPGEHDLAHIDLNSSIDSTINIVWNEIKYKATVKKDYSKLPLVRCYPQQISQVIMNILVNAAHAIETKGEVRVVTRTSDDQVKISIKDTGKGIPKENLSKIFDPFFTTKPVGTGTGLGLNVAYKIIEKHRGKIQVESQVDQGTTFHITLPVE